MRYRMIFACLITLASPALAAPRDYAAAVAPKGRPASAIALDTSRKPAEILDFLGLKPGMTVLDVMAGGGYYSQIMARVVGIKGRVIAWEPSQFMGPESRKQWAPLLKAQPNINLMIFPVEQFQLARDSFDFTMIHLNYHDFYWSSAKYGITASDPDKALLQLFHATRPGGIVGVIDHVGGKGETRATVDALHRIDPETVKADFARAGFVLEAESDVLRNPEDNLAALVFDPAVRGKTDRFVMRFRRPAL